MHEYGYLGSPVFNRRGHLIGISYLDRGHLQARGVYRLQNDVLSKLDG
uniref:Uncharacterized protein n=1 Tax=Aegilops tauschii subsp. strangulata TaxID=200361 RepID=A0A453FLC6_AEGTS